MLTSTIRGSGVVRHAELTATTADVLVGNVVNGPTGFSVRTIHFDNRETLDDAIRMLEAIRQEMDQLERAERARR
jgi:hypothetical protein